jgi:hypothetical protein
MAISDLKKRESSCNPMIFGADVDLLLIMNSDFSRIKYLRDIARVKLEQKKSSNSEFLMVLFT